MNEAAATWALVVGIDEYDKPELRRLQGAVADAVAAVGWLRRLGVPAQQILLHLAPKEADHHRLAGLGVPFEAARKADLVRSVNRLRRVRGGARLFIFLCGHGLYEPARKRLFLPQDAGVDDIWVNLGLEAYCDLFRTMEFKRQFLVMDGCLNYPYPDNVRPRIDAEGFPALPDQVPDPNVSLVACYAAAQDQRAAELEGRGAFMRRLLAGLDLADPAYPEAIAFDFSTGARTIDIRSLLLKWAAPTVQADVRKAANLSQTPQLEPLGAAQGQDVLPICRLPDLDPPPSTIELSIDPPQAARDVVAIRVAMQRRPWWSITVPVPPDVAVQVPVVARLPRNVPAQVVCEVEPGAPWDVARAFLDLPTAHDGRFTFEFLPRPPAGAGVGQASEDDDLSFDGDGGTAEPDSPETDVFSVQTVTAGEDARPDVPTGATPPRGTGATEVGTDEPAPPGVVLRRHAGRADLLVEPHARELAAAMALREADAMARTTPADVGILTVIRGHTPPAETPNVRVHPPEGGVQRLAGLLTGRRVLWIGPPGQRDDQGRWLTLSEARDGLTLRFEPGPVEFRLRLPWGSWTYAGFAPRIGELVVALPASIGIPPLRVGLSDELDRHTRTREARVLGVSSQPPEGHIRFGLDGPVGPPMASSAHGSAAWALAIPLASAGPRAPLAVLEASPRLVFPVPPDHELAVDVVAGPRVEPLSNVDAPEWDLLVATGRLDALSPDDVTNLSYGKWFDPFLGLASGYATWSLQAWRHVEIIVGNLGRLTTTSPWPNLQPDLDLLHASLEYRDQGRLSSRTVQVLAGHAATGAVPYLRWGVPLALDLLEGLAAPEVLVRWRSRLHQVSRTLSPVSVWTTWTE